MTSILQPLDVGVNRPMKSLLKAKWGQWMQHSTKTYTKGIRTRAPDLLTVTQWVKEAWKELDPSIIVKSFKRCSITNSMDGTEDNILWPDPRTEDTEDIADEDFEDNDEDDQFYQDIMPIEQVKQLFDTSDDEVLNKLYYLFIWFLKCMFGVHKEKCS